MQYIDLHLHLDGAITPEIAKELAALQGIDVPNDEELLRLLTVSDDCKSLNEFLECFAFPLSLLQTKEGLRESVRLVMDNIASQGVVYAEIRFAPQLHTEKGMRQEEAVIAAVEGLKSSGIKGNLILCCMRGADPEKNYETVEIARKYIVEDGGVVAVDLAGAEALYPTRDYREIFRRAKDYGMPFTIHAGEADGSESVRAAIDFGAKRIGHGVRSEEDPELLQLIKSEGIVLEMCPTSNRLTNAVKDMNTYPLLKYLDMGIKVTLNTDDMAIEQTTLPKEYSYMREKFGLTDEQENILLNNAVNAAFTSDSVKEKLRALIAR